MNNKNLLSHFKQELIDIKNLNPIDNVFIGGTYGISLHGLELGKNLNELDIILVNPTKEQSNYIIKWKLGHKTFIEYLDTEIIDTDLMNKLKDVDLDEELESSSTDNQTNENDLKLLNVNLKSVHSTKIKKQEYFIDFIIVNTINNEITDIIGENEFLYTYLNNNNNDNDNDNTLIKILTVNYIIKEKLNYTYKSKKGISYSRTKDMIDICNLKNLNFNYNIQ